MQTIRESVDVLNAQVASVGEKHWRGLQSYLNDTESAQNGEGDGDRQQSADDEWEKWDTKGDEDKDDKDTMDNGWDDGEWNSTGWNTSKTSTKAKSKVKNSFTKKENTDSNGWDNIDMDQWDDADWTPSKQQMKGD